ARMGRGGGANSNGDRPEPPQPSGLLSDASRAVDVLQLPLAPGGHFRGVLAARGAGEHVGDDVLFLDLARLPVPRTGVAGGAAVARVLGENRRSEEHTSELQSRENLVCRLLLEKK